MVDTKHHWARRPASHGHLNWTQAGRGMGATMVAGGAGAVDAVGIFGIPLLLLLLLLLTAALLEGRAPYQKVNSTELSVSLSGGRGVAVSCSWPANSSFCCHQQCEGHWKEFSSTIRKYRNLVCFLKLELHCVNVVPLPTHPHGLSAVLGISECCFHKTKLPVSWGISPVLLKSCPSDPLTNACGMCP